MIVVVILFVGLLIYAFVTRNHEYVPPAPKPPKDQFYALRPYGVDLSMTERSVRAEWDEYEQRMERWRRENGR